MICNECGAELENNSGTCPSCGAPVPPDSDVDETAVFDEGAHPDGDAVAAVQLLPYHNWGVAKYLRIGDGPVMEATPPGDEAMDKLAACMRAYGLPVTIH